MTITATDKEEKKKPRVFASRGGFVVVNSMRRVMLR
jgi:hypothetical protein